MRHLATPTLIKSLIAALTLPILASLVMTVFTLMYASGKTSAVQLILFYLVLMGLFSALTPLNNSITTALTSMLRLQNFFFFTLIGGLLYGAFFTVLTSGDVLWRNISAVSFYGFGLGAASSLMFYWLVLKPHASYKDKPVHWLPNLVLVGIACMLIKLFIAHYKPASNIAVYLAPKPSPSLDSYLDSAPTTRPILEGKIGYIGEYYFDLVFVWGWWILPGLIAVAAVLTLIRRRKS